MSNITALIQDLNGDTHTRLRARHQLENIGETCVPALIEAMATGGRTAWEAARLLGKWRVEAATPMLVKALHGNDPVLGQIAVAALDQIEGDAMTRTFIDVLPYAHCMTQLDLISALERRKSTRALPVLCDLLNKTDSNMMRLCLIQAIGLLGNSQHIDLIVTYEDHEDTHIQKRVRIALKRLREQADNPDEDSHTCP